MSGAGRGVHQTQARLCPKWTRRRDRISAARHSIPKTTRQRIAPGSQHASGAGQTRIRDRLERRWSDLNGAGSGGVARFFCRCTPYSILANKMPRR